MRTIAEIKEGIQNDFMSNEAVAKCYGFVSGDDFSKHFSTISIESLLFYVFACSAWVLENMFVNHQQQIESRIDQILPHRPKWYRDKVLNFMANKELIEDTDLYDTSGMSDSEIATSQVVKHAVATENAEASILTIKVAGELGGVRCKLPEPTQTQLAAYIGEIKDAGVRINLVNRDPDTFNCRVDIYYNAMLLPENVHDLAYLSIKTYIENLPFNGEYTNMALVDVLQNVDGVNIIELRQATTSSAELSVVTSINARYVPEAGYFKTGEIIINMIANA